MIFDDHRLSWVCRVTFLWYVFTGALHGPAELAGRALHDMVQDAGCIFVPVQLS
jgi:hypothetical protein